MTALLTQQGRQMDGFRLEIGGREDSAAQDAPLSWKGRADDRRRRVHQVQQSVHFAADVAPQSRINLLVPQPLYGRAETQL